MPLDELQGTAELVDDRSLRLNAVQTDVAGLDRYGRRRSVVRGQHRLKHGRPHHVLPACHSKRELRGKGSHAGGAGHAATPAATSSRLRCPGECLQTFISSGA